MPFYRCCSPSGSPIKNEDLIQAEVDGVIYPLPCFEQRLRDVDINFNYPCYIGDLGPIYSNSFLNSFGIFSNTAMNSPVLVEADYNNIQYPDTLLSDNGSVSLSFASWFSNCTEFSSNFIFNVKYPENFRNVSVRRMFSGTNNQKVKNIYTYDTSIFTQNGTAVSIMGNLTWTAMTNGCYNAAANIYIYTNVQDAVNWFKQTYSQYMG